MATEADDSPPDDTPEQRDSGPRVYRCVDCKAPIPDLVIAPGCEACGSHIGDDRYLIDEVTTDLLEGLAREAEGCLTCESPTGSVFCSAQCSERWFSTYTDAFQR